MKEFSKRILARSDAVILDTETTGLDSSAEIVQIGILSLAGEVLVDTYVRPAIALSWPAAEAVHGISPEMVQDASLVSELAEQLRTVLRGKTIVVYNADYDHRLLHQTIAACHSASGLFVWLGDCWWVDVMEPYAEHWGNWSRYHQSYTWQSLTNACRQQGIRVVDEHSAIGDCRMTLALLKKIAGS